MSNGDYYLIITEKRRRRGGQEGGSMENDYSKTKVFLYPEVVRAFKKSLTSTIDRMESLMPHFNFDQRQEEEE